MKNKVIVIICIMAGIVTSLSEIVFIGMLGRIKTPNENTMVSIVNSLNCKIEADSVNGYILQNDKTIIRFLGYDSTEVAKQYIENYIEMREASSTYDKIQKLKRFNIEAYVIDENTLIERINNIVVTVNINDKNKEDTDKLVEILNNGYTA